MKPSGLSRYFAGVVAKSLSAVEASREASNQHEYNGTAALKGLFGTDDRTEISTKFLYLTDEEDTVSDDGFLTWYDARRAHETRTEYRLYFSRTAVSQRAAPKDSLFIALRTNGAALIVVAKASSTTEQQLRWLFGLADAGTDSFVLKNLGDASVSPIGFLEKLILAELGIEVPEQSDDQIERLAALYSLGFPPTRKLSELAREMTEKQVSVQDDPDQALMTWMAQEERLFRAIEKKIVLERLETGFAGDVDGFIGFSLSVQNRRKSRAGYALGNHVEAVLARRKIVFKREATTEKRNGPDFLFPGETAYHDPSFASCDLRMLAVKTSCKDRWRQVLAEADRISQKHLLTLEPSISISQTTEMQNANLKLVIPKAVQPSYSASQQDYLIDFNTFLELVT